MRIDDEFCKRLPTKPSQELIDFVNAKPNFNIQCLVYRVSYENGHKVASCKCTACGKEFSQEWVSQEGCPHTYSKCTFGFRNSLTNEAVCGKSITLCPHCESGVNVYHISDFGNHAARIQIAYEPFLTVEVLDGALCLLVWSARRLLRRNGTIENIITSAESNIYTKRNKKIITPSGLGWHVLSRHRTAIDSIKTTNIFPFKDELLKNTDFENAKLEKYFFSGNNVCPSMYAQLYRKHPNVENLIMNDVSFYVSERLKACCSYYYGYSIEKLTGIDFAESRPSKMLGLTKDELKEFAALKLNSDFLSFYKENKEKYSLSEVALLSKNFDIYGLRKIAKGKQNALKIARYLQKQKKYSTLVDYNFLHDYWEMLDQLEIKIDDKNRFPHKLHNAHDSMSKCLKERKAKILEEQYKNRYELLKKFSFEADGFLIRPCKNDGELFYEGKQLDHCVYSYAKRHCSGETAIFFVRKSDSPSTPFYTLEFDEKNCKIRQNRGYKNTTKDENVSQFAEKWLTYAKKIKEKENGKPKRVNSARNRTTTSA